MEFYSLVPDSLSFKIQYFWKYEKNSSFEFSVWKKGKITIMIHSCNFFIITFFFKYWKILVSFFLKVQHLGDSRHRYVEKSSWTGQLTMYCKLFSLSHVWIVCMYTVLINLNREILLWFIWFKISGFLFFYYD